MLRRELASGTGVLALALILLLARTGPAWPGAWTLPEGRGQAILGLTISEADGVFGAADDATLPDVSKREADLLLEYGARDALTLVFKPNVKLVDVAGAHGGERRGFGHTEIGARLRLWRSDVAVFSVQALARPPGARHAGDPLATADAGFEGELRLLAGRGFTALDRPAFVDAQLGYRGVAGPRADELHADLTVGIRPHPRLLLLAQTFNMQAMGRSDGHPRGRRHKLQFSGVWQASDAWSLQLGGVATVAGRHALREAGVIAGLWRRF